MRRIIERVVTVVTTTTWKISWETDPHPSPVKADPVSEELPLLEVLPEATSPRPTVIEAKEDDLWVAKSSLDKPADEPPDNPYFYQPKKGNEKS